MNTLSPAERELVALGAALGSNCAPCVAYHIAAAAKAGVTEAQIVEAMQFAEQVRQVPARAALDAARRALPLHTARLEPASDADAPAAPCCQ